MNELKQTNENSIENIRFVLSEYKDDKDLSNKTKIKLSDVGVLSEIVKDGLQTAGNIAGKADLVYIMLILMEGSCALVL